MEAGVDAIFERIQVHAVSALPFLERQTTNLHIDKRVIPAGATVGPRHLRIVTKQASVLVFADTKPMANFGHDCRSSSTALRVGVIDRYGCDPSNIYSLSYDGTLNTADGAPTTWPGDNTSYRIQINGTGDRAGFEAAVDDLKSRIDSDDLLLIHINNHGDVEGDPGEACWCTWPDEDPYFAGDFSSKLGELPKFSKLVCMFEPCHAGGFNAPVIAHSPAASTSVASAATIDRESIGSSDLHWDCFARDWIAAQAGHDPYGATLAFNPDGDHDGIVEAEEAFAYANAVKDPNDTPNFNESSETGGDIALGHQYVMWGWWCAILKRELEPYYVNLPIPEYYEQLRQAQPDLVKLTEEIDGRSAQLRSEYEPRLKAVIDEAFGGR
jgi:hypothetical protein